MPSSDYLYLDYAATSPLRAEAFEAMLPYLREAYGNPSSIHRLGRDALAALERARQDIATALGAGKDEIIFTSCGTESDNLALRGVVFGQMAGQPHGVAPTIVTWVQRLAANQGASSSRAAVMVENLRRWEWVTL
jgi:cysteine sulfinate desulfinase/cysteine desulfurase-like protein